ncbi:MAG: NAD+ synthase [Acidobacteriota bacterium]
MEKINNEVTVKVITEFIRNSVYKNGFKNGILGVSGGLDSAVVLDLTVKALGKDNTFALLMPYRLSSEESLKDGKLICEKLGVQYEVIDISLPVDSYFKNFPTDNKTLLGNKCARERMSVLYDFSERKKALVVGTSNKSEILIGYSTLYGDSAAAFLPIGDLYKTEVFQLAEYLDIPGPIRNKKPSADLWKDQTDEGEIGFTYEKLDEILFNLIDRRMEKKDIEKLGFTLKDINKIEKMIINTQFKRTMPPATKIHSRTVGIDFRYPRDWNK